MSNAATHYRDLAARAQQEAGEASLENVRERALRSAAAFEAMALQLDRTARLKADREVASSTVEVIDG